MVAKKLSLKSKLSEPVFSGRPSKLIGDFFRARRLEAGLSVEMVSNYLGLRSTHDLTAFEQGTKPIPLNTIYGMANCMNVPPEAVVSLIERASHPHRK